MPQGHFLSVRAQKGSKEVLKGVSIPPRDKGFLIFTNPFCRYVYRQNEVCACFYFLLFALTPETTMAAALDPP